MFDDVNVIALKRKRPELTGVYVATVHLRLGLRLMSKLCLCERTGIFQYAWRAELLAFHLKA